MLFNLSVKNIRKSIKDYTIYFFTLVVAVTIFYLFNSLDTQNSMLKLTESKYEMVQTLVLLISYVSVFVSVILGFLIIYSNNFLIKRRKKEMGLYLTLGMNKRKVSTILVMETLIVGLCSLMVGIVLGVCLSQLLSVFTARLFEVDMSNFKFVFSKAALIKTIIYFGVIFLLVMIFNVISLSRYKLIDLLSAHKKNEKVKFRNKYVLTITFILTIILYYYAYKLLFNGALYQFDKKLLEMVICGGIGTLLLFFSISGVLLQLLQLIKRIYYRKLNTFVLKQINSKVNTTVISTTIISLMLLLTIGILSGSMSFIGVFNDGLSSNNLTDFTIMQSSEIYVMDENRNDIKEKASGFSEIINDKELNKYVDEYVRYFTYSDENVTIDSFMDQKAKEKANEEFKGQISFNAQIPLIKYSEYLKMVELYNRDDLKYQLKDNQYILLCNVDKVIEYYKDGFSSGIKINLNNKELSSATDKIVNISLQNYNGSGNSGAVVVPDNLLENKEPTMGYLLGNYIKTDNVDGLEKEFLNYLDSKNIKASYEMTKLEMQASSVGIKAIMTFVGLYLGIVFAISSATILAIGQLSESSDNKERFKILKLIGTDDKMVNQALFMQIVIAFMLPLAVALVHALFGLKELNKIIEMFGHIDLTKNIVLTSLFIIIVYGGYFVATYLSSKNIIKEK